MKQPELTILIPCLNEEATLAVCIRKASSFLRDNGIEGEVLIADNGSTDKSKEIALSHEARVIDVPQRGYGAALIAGCNAAYGKYTIMGDADDSYDLANLMPFVKRLRAGDDLVMGNRFKGGIEKGAMPFLHRYIGNPVLSGLGRLFFKCPIRDFHCGLRGYNTKRMRELDLHTTGMEYASEMVVQATINGYKISEVPVTLSKDGRTSAPHLHTWRDGWRHLKFLLMHSPNWLFLFPGLLLALLGTAVGTVIVVRSINIFDAVLGINTLFYCAVMLIIGFNLIMFHAYTKLYAIHTGFIKVGDRYLKWLSAEKCVVAGVCMAIAGIVLTFFAFTQWGRTSFGELIPENFMRITIPAGTLVICGVQLVFSGFFIAILRISTRK